MSIDGTHVRVAVVGAGFAGLAMAAQLLRHGEHDLVVLERAGEVGGTWRDNTYPGAACDIRSDLYSFSFAPHPGWSSRYAGQAEIQHYLRRTARDEGLLPYLRLDHDVTQAAWDDEASLWRLTTSQGELTAEVLVAGAGPLIQPRWPDVPGLQDFAGERFHSARWRHDVDLTGRRVAVIGTGASAAQLVPHVRRDAGTVHVFQRTPPWVHPRGDRPTSLLRRELFARVPLLQRLVRRALYVRNDATWLAFRYERVGRLAAVRGLRHLHRQVDDPRLREALTPRYRIGCKRIIVSDDYYPALTQPDVELVTDAITGISARAVHTADGTAREVDVLICGTGFDATDPPVAHVVRGRDGRTLAEHWSEHGMQALRGTTVAGFPNFCMLVGPNTALGHNSVVHVIETQVGYVLQLLALQRKDGARHVLDVRPAAQQAYARRLQQQLAGSVWTTGGCSSFYLDEHGRNTTLWPGPAVRFARSLRRLDRSEYDVRRVPVRPPWAEQPPAGGIPAGGTGTPLP